MALERVAGGVLSMVLLGACSGGSDSTSTEVVLLSNPNPVVAVAGGESGPAGSSPVVSWEHLVRDDNGSYFCLLRRGDDLAGLRLRFNQPTG